MSAWTELIANLDIPDGPADQREAIMDEESREARKALENNGAGIYPPTPE